MVSIKNLLVNIFYGFLILNLILFGYLTIKVHSMSKEKNIVKSVKVAFLIIIMGYMYIIGREKDKLFRHKPQVQGYYKGL